MKQKITFWKQKLQQQLTATVLVYLLPLFSIRLFIFPIFWGAFIAKILFVFFFIYSPKTSLTPHNVLQDYCCAFALSKLYKFFVCFVNAILTIFFVLLRQMQDIFSSLTVSVCLSVSIYFNCFEQTNIGKDKQSLVVN